MYFKDRKHTHTHTQKFTNLLKVSPESPLLFFCENSALEPRGGRTVLSSRDKTGNRWVRMNLGLKWEMDTREVRLIIAIPPVSEDGKE